MSRLASSEPATKTRLPQTMGELVPSLGIATFQTTLSIVFPSHFSGAFLWAATPMPEAPRKAGHAVAGDASPGDFVGAVSPVGFGASPVGVPFDSVVP